MTVRPRREVMVGLVWAQAAGGVIGRDGALPWHLPEDLARFKALTDGCTVVMGRATWESLPDRFRPLPGRRNVVLTRQPGWSAPGAVPAGSLNEALRDAGGEVWVIGGASVYAAALPVADRVEVTELRDAYEGDVRAPQLGDAWQLTAREPADGWRDSRAGPAYRFLTYLRAPR